LDETGWGAGRRVAAVGIPALALLGLALYLTAPERRPAEPDPQPAPGAPTAASPAEEPPTAEAVPVETPPEAPTFDVVRIEPGGSAVVAGTAPPGAEVTIYADAAPLAQATADADGNFVAIFEAPPAAVPKALTLGMTTADGAPLTSGEVVLLLPPAPPVASRQPPSTPEVTPVDEPTPAAEPEVAATAIVRADSVEVAPAEPDPIADREVILGSISYAEAGEVTLDGLGSAGSLLRAYVDDRLAHEARVGADGRWSMDLADVAEGVYTLRIDQLDPEGRVESRIETPFQRDFPRAPLPRPEAPGSADVAGAVTVQPGHNLWTLARLHYGSGVLYTQIFTANRDLIRDPDLIYPGQIFDLPEVDGTE
jgi:nucleoid-associated protein YgaU